MPPTSRDQLPEGGAAKDAASQDKTHQPTTQEIDSGSGSENGEKPVREKLKQTDLDEAREGVIDPQRHAESSEDSKDKARQKSPRKRSLEEEDEPHTPSGTHVRKRSRDAEYRKPEDSTTQVSTEGMREDNGAAAKQHLHSDAIDTPASSENEYPEATGAEKRPKKKRSLDDMDMYSDSDRERKLAATEMSRARRSSSEGPDENPNYEQFAAELRDRKNGTKDTEEECTPGEVKREALQENAMEDRTEPARKSKKKRSRDALDEQHEREQKKSSSARQPHMTDTSSEPIGDPVHAPRIQTDLTASSAPESTANEKGSEEKSRARAPVDTAIPPSNASKSVLGSTNGLAQVQSSAKMTLEDLPQTSAKAFAASGFATMAGATSPFGSLGTQAASASSPFGTLGAGSEPKSPPSDVLPQTSSSAFATSGFGSMTGSTSPFGAVGGKSGSKGSTFGVSGGNSPNPTSLLGPIASPNPRSTSPFASAGAQSGFSSLGSNAVGGGFGGGFGGGSKLTSFAAPFGDTNLGSTAKAKPFGAPAEDEEQDDEEADDSDDEGGDRVHAEEDTAVGERQGHHDSNMTQNDQSRKYKIKEGKFYGFLPLSISCIPRC